MSSSRRLLLAAGLLLAGQSMLSSQSVPAAAPLTCPASITVTAAASVAAPWQAESVKSEHKFESPSIYNGTPGRQEYDLAPDDTQTAGNRVRETWKLADYRDMTLFLRCRYLGTPATVVTIIPAAVKTCVFSFQNVAGNHPVASPLFECK